MREDEPLSDHDLVGNRRLEGLLSRRRAGGAPSRAPGAKLYVLYAVDKDLAFHAGIHYCDDLQELRKAGE